MAKRKSQKPAKARARRHPAPLDADARRVFEQAMAAVNRRDHAQAERLLLSIDQRTPGHGSVSYLLGMIHVDTGRLASGLSYLEQAAAISPDNPRFHFHVGDVLARSGRFDEAATALRRAIRLDAAFRDAYALLGAVLYKSARYREARQAFAEALRLDPADPRLHMNVAGTLIELGLRQEALDALRSAEHLAGGAEAGFLVDLARLHARLGQSDETERLYRAAIAADPDNPGIWEAMAWEQARSRTLDEAIPTFRHAAALRGTPEAAHRLIAAAAGTNGLVDEASVHYRKAIEFAPKELGPRSGLLVCENYKHDISAETLFQDHLAVRDCLPASQPHRFANDCEPGRVLNVGYVSADFRDHSVAYFIGPVLKQHNKRQVRVHAYFNGNNPDAVTARIRSNVAVWREIHGLTDQQVLDLIRADGIDILVDLSGHTRGNRLTVFAQRAAPVQITWLGYPNTTGVPNMDYRITDGIADPVGQTERFHTERLLRMPEIFSCYQPSSAAPAVAPAPLTHSDHVTFGSFNNYNKLNDFVLELWADVLLAVPDARLLLKDKNFADEGIRQRVIAAFARKGVAAARLQLLARDQSPGDHLARYHAIDIALDPFPYCGTTTTCEALWMGVPVVTLAGADHRSRVGLSQLTAVGLGELAASDREGYIAIARKLAGDPQRLCDLRSGMRQRLKSSPLMDHRGFTHALEHNYREAWESWCTRPGAS